MVRVDLAHRVVDGLVEQGLQATYLQLTESPLADEFIEVGRFEDERRAAAREVASEQGRAAQDLLPGDMAGEKLVKEPSPQAHLGLDPYTLGLLDEEMPVEALQYPGPEDIVRHRGYWKSLAVCDLQNTPGYRAE